MEQEQYRREVQEAIDAADRALYSLERARRSAARRTASKRKQAKTRAGCTVTNGHPTETGPALMEASVKHRMNEVHCYVNIQRDPG
jgi:hypothetical protein